MEVLNGMPKSLLPKSSSAEDPEVAATSCTKLTKLSALSTKWLFTRTSLLMSAASVQQPTNPRSMCRLVTGTLDLSTDRNTEPKVSMPKWHITMCSAQPGQRSSRKTRCVCVCSHVHQVICQDGNQARLWVVLVASLWGILHCQLPASMEITHRKKLGYSRHSTCTPSERTLRT